MSFKGSLSGASGGGIAARSNSTRTSKSTAKDEHNFKLVMVGDSGVGKSCLLEKFLDLSSNNAFISTIGVDVRSHVLKLDGHLIKLQVSLKLFVKSIITNHCHLTKKSIFMNFFSYRYLFGKLKCVVLTKKNLRLNWNFYIKWIRIFQINLIFFFKVKKFDFLGKILKVYVKLEFFSIKIFFM